MAFIRNNMTGLLVGVVVGYWVVPKVISKVR